MPLISTLASTLVSHVTREVHSFVAKPFLYHKNFWYMLFSPLTIKNSYLRKRQLYVYAGNKTTIKAKGTFLTE